jgi:hypothetical protein
LFIRAGVIIDSGDCLVSDFQKFHGQTVATARINTALKPPKQCCFPVIRRTIV